ncbi:hypothetical protein DJ568_15530 [Mucilaginibacter hurinus]|uniref:Uncharacterized protein n=1 Tax=Mucilaginibacter hurinus TaxID=2201324 RepID=A0A367GKF7_9SPHI|nr:hypothetical protein [Mucilaginibacter hurinus]RCH53949.1 hypothetical protein DJ568_15530 [Mucilaginibacter hurinus]
MEALITINDIKAIRQIAQAINNPARIEPLIQEAQQSEVKRLLGPELLYDLLKNSGDAKYQDLLNGKQYTNKRGHDVRLEGLKVVIAYFTYARFILSDNLKHTDAGFVVKQTQFSEAASQQHIMAKYQDARSMALAYWADCEEFLNDKKINYPLWTYCGNKSGDVTSSAKISAVSNRNNDWRNK